MNLVVSDWINFEVSRAILSRVFDLILSPLPFCYCKKQMDVSFSCVCPVIDNEFRHNIDNIVKVVCGSTRLLARGSTATLTMLWWNSWSITGQTHEKGRQMREGNICLNQAEYGTCTWNNLTGTHVHLNCVVNLAFCPQDLCFLISNDLTN